MPAHHPDSQWYWWKNRAGSSLSGSRPDTREWWSHSEPDRTRIDGKLIIGGRSEIGLHRLIIACGIIEHAIHDTRIICKVAFSGETDKDHNVVDSPVVELRIVGASAATGLAGAFTCPTFSQPFIGRDVEIRNQTDRSGIDTVRNERCGDQLPFDFVGIHKIARCRIKNDGISFCIVQIVVILIPSCKAMERVAIRLD